MGNPYAKGHWHPSKGISLSQFNPIHGFSVNSTWREVDVSDAEVRVSTTVLGTDEERKHDTDQCVCPRLVCVKCWGIDMQR